MEQDAFSNIVRAYISKVHPIFLESISYQADGSFDCTLKNAKGEFSVWIATYNSEVTLGLQAADGNSDCHTHMSFYGEKPTEQLEAMKNHLEKIFSNKLLFMQSSLSGYSWTDNIEHALKKMKKNESIKFFKWDES
ncbi:hypothetical protein [Pontibacter akesuensis]|uniref:DUF4304 domain-containing protein n=1 Tax=Pontibacter akesuensis TaxID=388950 RepID=A0A1I7FNY4_9BACT|nr:hypothetical protein [Pontibacter akesuensis]GHA61231.1 hypothetical protein GCM10007389_12050 [Pontibacter akesuensis]SFU37893.1 hypothetical protein SAMN04487941_0356 [Pontibacter akesuensis]